jgi:integrase
MFFLLSKMILLFRVRKNVLYYRITINKKRSTDQSTGIRFDDTDQWNAKRQRFDNNDFNNELLARLKLKLQNIYLSLGAAATAADITKAYKANIPEGKEIVPKAKKKEKKGYNKELDKFLTDAEMSILESAKLGKDQKFLDVFIILMRTGMNYSDYKMLDFRAAIVKSEYGDYIRIERNKTSERAIIPLMPKVRELLEKYDYAPPKMSRIFLYKKTKQISKQLLSREITPKFGRKTMANYCLENSISIDVTAKILGHAGTEMVQRHYAQIREKRVMKEWGMIS